MACHRRRFWNKWRRPGCAKYPMSSGLRHKTVVNMLPGEYATVQGFCPRISKEQKAHLQAYGVIPGQKVCVIRQSPVTILQVDELELALEEELAMSIEITS